MQCSYSLFFLCSLPGAHGKVRMLGMEGLWQWGAVCLTMPVPCVGLGSFCRCESMRPQASMRARSTWNGKCWRYRGQLKSLWLSLLEALLALALPAWLSSGEFAQRCCLLAAERLLAASPLSWNREGQAVLWIHLMQIVAELVCLFLSSWMGRGNYRRPGNTHTQICVCLPGELGLQLVEWNPLALFSPWVSQLEFRVAVCRCGASKMQSWSFNSCELYGEDEPVGTLGPRAQVFYSLDLLSSLSSLPLEVMHTVKTH